MTTRHPARLAAALPVLLLVVVGLPGAVQAHAGLDTVNPKDASTVVGPPSEVVMTFTQHLDPARSNIKLVNAGGTVVAQDSTVDADKLTMRLPVPSDLPAGAYTARWVSFSTDDNEQDRGTTTFTVTAATPPPTAPPTAPASVAPSASPSAAVASDAPSVAPSASPGATTPTASTTDALIPIVVVVLAILGLGAWFAARSRRANPRG